MTNNVNLTIANQSLEKVLSPQSDFAVLPGRELLDCNAVVDALYVHVPFCTTKCHYCDFYSLAGHLDQIPRYLVALEQEIQLQLAHFGLPEPETIFIGGGTPTLLPPADLADLLRLLRRSIGSTRLREFTVEANPNTFDPARAQILVKAGVDRVSFGAQSFNPAELVTLQRDHDPASVPVAVGIARHAGLENINIDLIFGIPGQTLSSLHNSLKSALELQPDHISCYSLVYEPNTPMTARLKSGLITPMNETLELEMFELVRETLSAAGLFRYEVSNFARPGFECQHNLRYWRGGNYLAWGPAAAGHHSGYRWKNVPSLMRYTDALLAAQPCLPVTQMEHLQGLNRWGESVILALRLNEGLSLNTFREKTGLDAVAILADVLKKYDGLGLLLVDVETLRLSPGAVTVSDTILADVLAAFEAAARRAAAKK